MQKLAIFFWIIVAGIGLTFGASVYTAVQDSGAKRVEDPSSIPTPALPSS